VFLLLRQLQKHTFGSGEGSVKVKLYTASFRLVTCELMVFNLIFAIVTASLLIQLAVLSLLIYGYLLYRRLKFRLHGIIMSYTVFVQVAAVFSIMVPSFVLAVFPYYVVPHKLELASIVSLIHEVTGGLSFALGVWFVASWRFRKDFKGCFNKRKLMLATMIVWVTALAFGITLYTIFNWAILMG
jgi:hypothetical protein